MAWRQIAPSVAWVEASENPIHVVSTTIKVNRAFTKSLMTVTHPRRFREATVVSMGAATFTENLSSYCGNFRKDRSCQDPIFFSKLALMHPDGPARPATQSQGQRTHCNMGCGDIGSSIGEDGEQTQ